MLIIEVKYQNKKLIHRLMKISISRIDYNFIVCGNNHLRLIKFVFQNQFFFGQPLFYC